MTDLDLLDPEFEPGIDVERNPDGGTLRLNINTPKGRVLMNLHIHPRLAIALRDRLKILYPEKKWAESPDKKEKNNG